MGDLYTPNGKCVSNSPTTLARAASLADAAMKLLLVCAPARQTMSTAPTSTLDLAATVAVVWSALVDLQGLTTALLPLTLLSPRLFLAAIRSLEITAATT